MGDVNNKPGCFSAVTVFSHDSETCKGCSFFKECEEGSLSRLIKIKGLINVEDLLAKHERAQKTQRLIRETRRREVVESAPPPVQSNIQKQPITEPVKRKTELVKVEFEIDRESEQVIARISNQKAAQQAIVLCKSNRIERAKKLLAVGKNPFFEDGPKYLEVAAEMLLKGGFSRGSLKDKYQSRLGWVASTSASHVSVTIGLFTAFDIAKKDGDMFVLYP